MQPLDLPLLCLVTDRRRCGGRPLEEVVAAAVDGGVGAVQLREKDLPASKLYRLAERLREITSGRALLFVNDRLDVALATGADGVHLPESGLPIEAARRAAEGRLLVGRSVHSVQSGVAAESERADLLVVGTVFATATHPEVEPQGVAVLRELRYRVRVPYLGIGGVTPENVSDVIASGAAGAAVVAAIAGHSDPARAASQLVRAMSDAWASRPEAAQARSA